MFFALIFIGGFGSFSLLYFITNTSEGQQYWHSFKDTVDHLDFDQPSVLINRIGQAVMANGVTTATTAGTNENGSNNKNNNNNNDEDRESRQPPPAISKAPVTRRYKHVSPRNVTVTISNQTRLRIPPKVATRDRAKADQDKTPHSDPNKLNVVLFYADDWTMRVLGKYDKNVYTPNIDNLADNGMLFSNNCVTTSVCWISRASLVTGTYYARHLQNFPHATSVFETNPWKETLFPRMKQEGGYFTGLMGKWHAPGPNQEMDQAFSMRRFYYGAHWYGNQHVTDMNREHAITFLKERPKHMPFFLKVSFFATHARDGHYPSFEPMNQTRWTHYPDSKYIEPPKTATEAHWEALPSFFERSEGRTRWQRRFEPDYFQDNVKDLYSMATEVDWAVGEVIKELKAQGVYNNTLIIFTTDNGNLQGEHGKEL
jgi:Sulfatase